MIQADFYPTIQTEATDVEYTDLIENLDNSVDMFHPYVMGYLPGTYIPDHLFVSAYEATDAAGMEDDGIIFRPMYNKAANFPWFFTACRKTSIMDRRAGKLLFLDGAWTDFNNSASENDYQLLNGFNISLNAFRSFTLSFNYAVYDNTRNTNLRTMSTVSTKVAVTTAELIDFLYNDGTIDLTISHSGYTSSSSVLSLHASDFDPGMAHFLLTLHHKNTDQDCEIDIHIVISNFTWTITRIMNEGGSAFGYPNESVAFQWDTTDGIHVVSSLNNGGSISTDGYISIRKDASRIYEIESGVHKKTILDTVYVGCGLDGDIPGSFIRNAPTYSLMLRKNFVVQIVGSTRIAVVPLQMINDLKNTLCFIGVRITETNAPYGFSDEVYVPHYKADDSPNFDLLNGDLDTIVNDLRPWQMYNINNNDFTWDDIPPYVPPGPPGGDDNSETGDKIPNQFGRNVGVTSNFITQYLLTQGQISKLGEVLWTSWADDTVTMQMVENFYGKLHDETGSWNVSSALQFLVSCRMFPMSLATLVGTTATTSIPIGTGAFALQCGTASEPTFFIANESVAVLNCGDVYVPKEFGDYRDFDNTNITAYLPYCGSVQLSPQDVVGKWLGCTYAIDLFDGSCKAFLYTLSGDDVGYAGAYYNVAIKEGQCGFLIPMSATQAGEVASRRKVDSYVDGSMLFNAGSTMLDGTMRIASGDGLGAIGADVGRLANLGFAYNTLSAQRMGRAGIAAPTIAGGSGFADFMQPASPYIQIRRSRYQMPIQYENSAAYPTNAQNYGNLSQFTGFVQCKNVDVHGFTCHEEERSAIKALLESGVYL